MSDIIKIERQGNFIYELMENPNNHTTPFVNKWWAQIQKQVGFNVPDEDIEKVVALFMAAPKMLEALEALVNGVETDNKNLVLAYNNAKLIIRKAKGE